MTSAIDPTKPSTGTPTTASVRSNFATAASEITNLQSGKLDNAGGPGLLVSTSGTTTTSARAIASGSTGITVANGDGVAGNPTITLATPTTSVLGGVKALAAVAHEFVTGVGVDGGPTAAQPAFADLSGVATGAQLPTPTPTTLGGVKSLAAASNEFLTAIGTDGTPTQARPSVANLSDGSTGTGAVVLASGPTLVAPALGTPASGTLTNCAGLPIAGIAALGAGLGAFLATPTSANLAAAITDETGTGALVFANTPTLVTPVLGVASATTLNKVTVTPPSTGATLTIANGATLTAGANATVSGTNTGDVAVAGQNYLSLAGQTLTANAVDLSGTNATGTLAAARLPALTGDVTTSAGTVATSIGANKVGNSQLAQAPANTIKGNNTGSTANEADLTVQQVWSMLGCPLNRLINGDIRIDQRLNGAVTTNGLFAADRWPLSQNGATTGSLQRLTATPPAGFTAYLRLTTTATTAVGTTDFLNFLVNIEGLSVADLGSGTANAQTVTVSFWVRNTKTGTFPIAIRNGTGARSYVSTFTINAANTWEYKTLTIALDTTGTWVTDNTRGMTLALATCCGATYQAAAGSWAAGNFFGASGMTQNNTNGDAMDITAVQLQAGAAATPFERRLFGAELALCQRYYTSTFDLGTAPADGLTLGGPSGEFRISQAAAGEPIAVWLFPVKMRASPVVTLYNPRVSGAAGQWTNGTADTTNARALWPVQSRVIIDNSGNASPVAGQWHIAAAANAEL